ncbi:hypothetical protein RBU60_09255 [Mesonia sp. MT50]|uniref:Uncharacterized protein n=1 Tax=Mesonia profundi TaxID=3070998 RepID=A0ABU1A245_9FLAO|nr:hypothetical protein [Mesonia profundi]MDQ7917761.1 hypothetical protein [Mesonia profundi]
MYRKTLIFAAPKKANIIKYFRKEHIYILPLLSIFVIHLLFLYHIITEEKNLVYASLFTMLIMFLVSIGYLYLFQKDKKLKLGAWYLVFAVMLGALATTYLYIGLGLSAVISSALVGVIGALVPKNFPSPHKGQSIRTAIYCGSFIGMGQAFLEHHYLFIAFAGLVSGIYFCISTNRLKGFGGKLGTLAFVGVAISYFLTYLFFK